MVVCAVLVQVYNSLTKHGRSGESRTLGDLGFEQFEPSTLHNYLMS
jgi:hypothetical protein